jgi:NADH:ubiquinone oxidoreductase subunit K
MDWNTIFPYALIAAIILIGLGIYSLITSKRFLQIVFGIELMFFAAILVLLSFGRGFDGPVLIPDPFAHVLAIMIIVVSIIFLIIGTALDRSLRQSGDSTIIDFNFQVDEVEQLAISEMPDTESKREIAENRG